MGLIFINHKYLLKITFTCTLVIVLVQTRKVNMIRRSQDILVNEFQHDRNLLRLLRGLKDGRKTLNDDTISKARLLYHVLTKKLLRQNEEGKITVPEADTKNDDPTLVEQELEDSLAKKSSALKDKPFVQHKGENDFLVFKTGVKDPFVTVVPNDIYYNVEKRCVNWLDDCNERGLRARFLQLVQSPYK